MPIPAYKISESQAQTADLSGGYSLKKATVRVADASDENPVAINSLSQVADPVFRGFVGAALSEFDTALQMAVPPAGLNAGSAIELTFFHIPLVLDAAPVRAAPDLSSAACAIDSPWATILLGEDEPDLQAWIYFDERQVLRDQAQLRDPDVHLPARAQPLAEARFDEVAGIYADALMRGASGGAIEPPGIDRDLLFLFQSAPQATLFPFAEGARTYLRDLGVELAPSYAQLIVGLLTLCQNPKTSLIHISGINELAEEKAAISP